MLWDTIREAYIFEGRGSVRFSLGQTPKYPIMLAVENQKCVLHTCVSVTAVIVSYFGSVLEVGGGGPSFKRI
jgi:hypothetical protein